MSLNNATTSFIARANYIVNPLDVSKVLCHRRREEREQFLIRWRTKPEFPVPPRAICSWHELAELSECLHLIQIYLETRKLLKSSTATPNGHIKAPSLKRKRQSPDSELLSRDQQLGVRNSAPLSSQLGRSPSVLSINSSSASASSYGADDIVYNGVLERKEGRIVAKRVKRIKVPKINATNLPTPEMLEEAASTPIMQVERLIRQAFHKKLERVPKVSLENKIDKSTPSLDFEFIQDYVVGEGVHRNDPESYEGCDKPCKPNMGNHIGCEWPKECACLEYAAVNEDVLLKDNPVMFREYKRMKEVGDFIDTKGLPKRFPYHAPKGPGFPQTLVQFYREQRYPIYECNTNCRCGPVCKSRVVQKGRKVPLTIFKTADRGWGVYCNEDLIQGEFIDTYLGEIITNAEADRREQISSREKQSYLYSLDKFVGDADDLTQETCYVVDGQYMGGPTRFINHSCEPNCRQYTVSYDKNDPRIYDIAFFATDNIRAGTELMFDYMDQDEEEEESAVRKREAALRDPANAGMQRCGCGARKCRGFLWA